MKHGNFLKCSIFGLLLLSTGMVNAQDVIADFSWTNTTGSTNSSGQIVGCNGSIVNVTMTSTPLGHDLTGTTGAYFPEDPDDAGDVTVTINFSPAVLDLSILMNDYDEHEPSGSDDGSPSELGSGFSPAFTSVSPVVGSSTFVPTGPVGAYTGVDPNGAENTQGWVNWTGSISSVTFTYERPDAGAGEGGWGLILESMAFNCESTLSCICSDKNRFIKIGKVFQNGQTSSQIHVNSGGVAISTLNISIPFWKSLIDPSCLDCDAKRLLIAGNITNLPTIAGVTPTFAGSGSSASEIVYQFPTPTVISQNIWLNMQFPPVLKLACCLNRVDYCIKIQMITEKCEVCETTICLSDKVSSPSKESKTKSTEIKPSTNVDSQVSLNRISIHPNPASNFVNIELPKTEGVIYVYTVDGQLVNQMNTTSRTVQLNTQEMETGSYILKYIYGEKTLNSKFIVK